MLKVPNPALQPSLAVAEVVVDDVGVLARFGVPEQLTLPITGEGRLCGQLVEPPFVLGGRVHGYDQGPISDRSVQTRVVQDPLQGLADLPALARRHRPREALDLVDVVAVGLWLANVEAAIALGGPAAPGRGSLLKEEDGHHPLKELARIGAPVDRPDGSRRFRRNLRLLLLRKRVGMRIAVPSPMSGVEARRSTSTRRPSANE
jgi:hypothetical protein